jgi:hypothetical protein
LLIFLTVLQRDFAPNYDNIPPHGRWQHFDVGGTQRVSKLLASWEAEVDAKERTRRLVDLFLVSVLLDAGAGVKWAYTSKENGRRYTRSEGLAVASLEMFKAAAFSGVKEQPFQVDAAGLKGVTTASLAEGLQVSAENPIAGLEGRASLLVGLGHALESNKQIFGETARPGNMIGITPLYSPAARLTVQDYLLAHETTRGADPPTIDTTTLWDALMTGLLPIWPAKRTQLDGTSLGDSWPCASLPQPAAGAAAWEGIAPFHKLTQWLCYSLMPPMTRMLGARFAHAELLTGLPEYRNGGLLVDTGLLTLREPERQRGEEAYRVHMAATGAKCMEVVPVFTPDDDVVVEWRCVTVGFLDEIHAAVNEELGLVGSSRLSLAQVLEAGTWKVRLSVLGCVYADGARADVRLRRCRGPIPRSPLS